MMARFILLVLILAATAIPAQNTRPAPPSSSDQKFDEVLLDVRRLLAAKQFEQALDKLREAEALKPGHWAIANAQGNVFMSMKDYAKARDAYGRAGASNPGAFETQFNLAELDFVGRNYEAAQNAFSELLTSRANLPNQIKNLLRFKVIVCLVMLDKLADAEELAQKLKFREESPENYFTLALFAIKKKDPASGGQWIAKAQQAFKPAEIEPYTDALVEAGWITIKPRAEATK